MPLVNVRQIPKFEVNRLSTLGGVRGHTDTHTQTHRGVTSFNNIDIPLKYEGNNSFFYLKKNFRVHSL